MEALSREAFFELPLDEVKERTGIKMSAGDDETEYRERAWKSYKQDVANEEEWGGTEGDSVTPPGEH